jgi:tetratricopeptide (TPR) repeat protein
MHQMQLQNALKAQQAGRLDVATNLIKQILERAPNDPHALHIAGFIARDCGNISQAESYFRASLQDHLGARTKAEFANNFAKFYLTQGHPDLALEITNFGKNSDQTFLPIRRLRTKLLSQMGLHQKAIAEASSLTVNSADPDNWLALANVYRNALDWPNVKKAAATLLQIEPGHLIGQHLFAIATAQLEPIEQAALCFSSIADNSDALVSLANAYLEAGQLELAKETLQEALKKSPSSLPALAAQAEFLWMTGEAKSALRPLEAACQSEPMNQALLMTLSGAAKKMGALDVALATVDKALTLNPDHPSLLVQRAAILAAQEKPAAAYELAQKATKAWPNNENVLRESAHIFIQVAHYQSALQLCERGIAMRPWSYEWIALMAAVKRSMGIEDHQDWFNFEKFVTSTPIDVPPGYDSVEAFNLELATWLKTRHTLKAHPLINSVRGGTQISLPVNQGRDPILDAFHSAISGPINRYIENLKALNHHPFAARITTGWRLSGLWSVCLRNGGGHVNHIHPNGWISSAYYVQLPSSVSCNPQHEGWIGFGAPRFPAPDSDHEVWIEPKAGNLALFPSYMWHGVKPFSDTSERITLAFDVVPL